MKSKHTRIQPSSTSFKISYTNIRCLRSNFPEVAAHIEEERHDFSLFVRLILARKSVVMISIFLGIPQSLQKTTALGAKDMALLFFYKRRSPMWESGCL